MIIASGKAMVKIECVVNTRGVLMPSVNIFSYIYNNVNKYSPVQKRARRWTGFAREVYRRENKGTAQGRVGAA